jgi:hypothetical protein
MATTYYLSPITYILQQVFSNLGYMAAQGTAYIYSAGTTTPATTYTDNTGLVANANPIVLSQAGRIVNSGQSAPVAVWAASGQVHKLIVFDTSGNQLIYLDNLALINDPGSSSSSLQTLLGTAPSSAASPTGVALVANALMSFANIAAMRAYGAPSLTSGQTLIAAVQGGSTNADGLAALFYWNATSTATDNGLTIITPTGVATGRWLVVPQQGFPLLQNIQKANYTTVLSDGNNSLYSDGSVADTWTIAANASVAYPIGTTLTFVNDSVGGSNAMTIAITSDTLVWAATAGTGSRTLAAGGMASALKVTSTRWIINGGGLT